MFKASRLSLSGLFYIIYTKNAIRQVTIKFYKIKSFEPHLWMRRFLNVCFSPLLVLSPTTWTVFDAGICEVALYIILAYRNLLVTTPTRA
jgi:hypothetical protein